MVREPLEKGFFMRDTSYVAEKLLGCYLMRRLGGSFLVGRIVETEAYLGVEDPCCHSFRGIQTSRTQTMFFSGGHSYVYFIYGKYHCFNVVTRSEREPEAVLIRALEPLEGIPQMKKSRQQEHLIHLCSGPGKLCQAFGIDKSLNGHLLSDKEGEIYISKGEVVTDIEVDRRVGLPLHKDAAYWPLRFYVKNSPFVSVKETL